MADTIESFVRAGSFRESWRDRFQNKWPAMTMMMKAETEIDYPNITPCPDFGIKNPSIRSWTSSTQDTWGESRTVDQVSTDEESSSRVTKKGSKCGRICQCVLCVFLVLSVLVAAFAGIGLAVLLTQPEFGLSGGTHSHEDSHIDAGLNEAQQTVLTRKFCNLVKTILKDVNFPTEKGIAKCEAILQLMKGSEGLHIELHVIPTDGYTLKEKFIRALSELVTKRSKDISIDSNTDILRTPIEKHDIPNFIFPKTGGVFTFNPGLSTIEDLPADDIDSMQPISTTVTSTTNVPLVKSNANVLGGDKKGSISVQSNSNRVEEKKTFINHNKGTMPDSNNGSTNTGTVDMGRIVGTEVVNEPISATESRQTISTNAAMKHNITSVNINKLQQNTRSITSNSTSFNASTSNLESSIDGVDNDERILQKQNGNTLKSSIKGKDAEIVTSISEVDLTSTSSTRNTTSSTQQNETMSRYTESTNSTRHVTLESNFNVNEHNASQQFTSQQELLETNYTDAGNMIDHNNTDNSTIARGTTDAIAMTPTKEYLRTINKPSTIDTVTIPNNDTNYANKESSVSEGSDSIYGLTESTQIITDVQIKETSETVQQTSQTNDTQNVTLNKTIKELQTNTSVENIEALPDTKELPQVVTIKSVKLFDVNSISNTTSESIPIYANETSKKSAKDFVAESLMTGGVFKLPMRTTSKFKFLFSSGPRNTDKQKIGRDDSPTVVVVKKAKEENTVK